MIRYSDISNEDFLNLFDKAIARIPFESFKMDVNKGRNMNGSK